jgi:hypothetical protein
MFGLDFVTILMIDIISQTLNIPHKLMHLFDKLTNGISAVWKVIITAAAAILAELKTTEQLTFTFSVHRSLLHPGPSLKVETHYPQVEPAIKQFEQFHQSSTPKSSLPSQASPSEMSPAIASSP